MPFSPAVVVDGLSYHLPDGTVILDAVSATFPAARTGLIGDNGSGKTTLLRLIGGRLRPTDGSVRVSGRVYTVPQRLTVAGTVADLLGIAGTVAGLRAIEAGSVAQQHFDAVGDDWDVEARAAAELTRIGLPDDPGFLGRGAATLSGGEATRIALAGACLALADVTLLDEPTNNLDARTRAWLYDELERWDGALIVVSHDRELLERVDGLVDLTRRGAVSFGGPFSAYEAYRAELREAAERGLRAAEAELDRARRQAQTELQRQAQRDRSARRELARGNVSKGAADFYQNRAEKGAGSKTVAHQQAVLDAQAARTEADDRARQPDTIRIPLPMTTVPAGKEVLRLRVGETRLDVVGPERIRLVGDNGSGKSTLLALVLGLDGDEPWRRAVLDGVSLDLAPAVAVGMLAQNLDGLDRFPSAIEAVRDAAPSRTPHDARALLARFLIRGDRADQPPSTMSGGERFRVGLARTLFADPAPQLLILDEPTNNLDLASVEQLVGALEDYRGALLVVTHDGHLASRLRVERQWEATRQAGPLKVADRLIG
ncbi:ABC-F family ATP-binding cassette domain-containing protein [Tessaracoccus defluvii]|uniref:ABC-F family ATP-binding cassette domain-containing protein n=1 Tax=Tessaracoccus defluvii TaxID=1285901 RepID=A0A7H0H3S1_9ACTN|nr:ATP-binding cassette domain-containing protein [Tessaracoccus defluvii]QNP55187.1 ABC-F family ATP-binding cassette domain-containing protein [Tessaracoccus defluvii]